MVSYEEERRRRVEENKKRLEELGIVEITKEIAKQTKKPARSPQIKKAQPLGFIRRSSRVTSNPRPNYKDEDIHLPGKRSRRSIRALPINCSSQDRMAALQAAEKKQQSLDRPSTVKTMLHSHVSGGFWLSLPLSFAREHLPTKDTMITLEDGDEHEFQSLYLAYKNGLSGGWRGFSINHELQDGDALIFELITPAHLKVHIFRVADYQDKPEKTSKSATERERPAKRSRR